MVQNSNQMACSKRRWPSNDAACTYTIAHAHARYACMQVRINTHVYACNAHTHTCARPCVRKLLSCLMTRVHQFSLPAQATPTFFRRIRSLSCCSAADSSSHLRQCRDRVCMPTLIIGNNLFSGSIIAKMLKCCNPCMERLMRRRSGSFIVWVSSMTKA